MPPWIEGLLSDSRDEVIALWRAPRAPHATLRDEVRSAIRTIRQWALPLTDLRQAELVAATLSIWLDAVDDDTPDAVFRPVQVAARYFARPEAVEDGLCDPCGFDDDYELLCVIADAWARPAA